MGWFVCAYSRFEKGNEDFLGPSNLLLRKDNLQDRTNSHIVCFKTTYRSRPTTHLGTDSFFNVGVGKGLTTFKQV